MFPEPIHVFFDNSNIWGGADAVRRDVEPAAHWAAFRLYYSNLFRAIEGGRQKKTAVLAGSVPPACEALWQYAKDAGYRTDLLRRVTTEEGKTEEQGVDELLHLKIANVILDHEPETLVVCTGDGRVSKFGTGFRTQIDRALKRGWKAEVWSWAYTLNGCYNRMAETHAGQMAVELLDGLYYSVTYRSRREEGRERCSPRRRRRGDAAQGPGAPEDRDGRVL